MNDKGFRSSLLLGKVVEMRLFCFGPDGGQKQMRSGGGHDLGSRFICG